MSSRRVAALFLAIAIVLVVVLALIVTGVVLVITRW